MFQIIVSLVSLILTIFLYIFYRAWKTNQHWKEKGIPHPKPMLFFGNNEPSLLEKMPIGQVHEHFCKQFPNEPLFGYYDFMKPTLVVKDIDYIEKIIIKDFAHFVDHGIIPLDDKRNPLDSNLFNMNGKRWKAVRSRLSPIFTTGKLKLMFESMIGCGDELIKQLDKGETHDVELKDTLSCFAMDTIGSCAFGIDSGSLSKPDNEFRRIGKQTSELNFLTSMKFLILMHLPLLNKLLNITFSKPHVTNYFSAIIKDTVKYRRENGFKRNDFIQLMMQLQDKGYVEVHIRDAADDYLNLDTTVYSKEKFELTDDQLTGHAVSFLTAGFDATSSAMLFTVYELSRNPSIQEKVRQEIRREIERAGSLTYDSLKDMTYLEQCVKEALRMYPPAQLLARVCTKQYTFNNGMTIDPGQPILIPTLSVHNDPKYYPDPRVFRPERFDPNNTIPVGAYLPFGNGPRICLAMRFAMLEIKFCIANLLRNCTVSISPKTKQPITLKPNSMITTPNEVLYFNIRENNILD
ncbi:probable cytochrome P450 6a14 [Rhodnius prolixus]|uniref:Putative cytochrome n=2 Tax=Rhodnius TaxID=13248 RepID=R4FMC5_RHOPR